MSSTDWDDSDFLDPYLPLPRTIGVVTQVKGPRTGMGVQTETKAAMVDRQAEMAVLVRSHQASVWRYLRYLGCCAAEADDLTQDTFLAVFRDGFEDRCPRQTAAYLRTVARNRLLAVRRSRKKTVEIDLEAAEAVWVEAVGSAGMDDYLVALEDCLEVRRHPAGASGPGAVLSPAAQPGRDRRAAGDGRRGCEDLVASSTGCAARMRGKEGGIMNEPNDQHDELRDRLLDQALRETLGAESPPDLTDRILVAAEEQTSEQPQPKGVGVMEKAKKKGRRWVWVAGGAAACLLIGTAILLSQGGLNGSREIAKAEHRLHAEQEKAQQIQMLVDELESLKSVSPEGAVDYAFVPSGPSTFDPYASGQSMAESARQPLMQGAGVQYNRIGGPGTVPGRPGHLTQQNQSRSLGFNPEGRSDYWAVQSGVEATSPSYFQFSAGVKGDAGLVGSVVIDESKSVDYRMAQTRAQGRTLKTGATFTVTPSAKYAPGQRLPSPWYTTDDVQYFPPGKEFLLAQEAAQELHQARLVVKEMEQQAMGGASIRLRKSVGSDPKVRVSRPRPRAGWGPVCAACGESVPGC